MTPNSTRTEAMNRPAVSNVRRKLDACSSFRSDELPPDIGRIPQAVARAPHRADKLRGEALVDFGAQPAQMRFDDIGLRVELILPYALEQHRAAQGLPRMAHQELEQGELAGLQRNLTSRTAH